LLFLGISSFILNVLNYFGKPEESESVGA
jgi:hypothetical protein